MSRKRIIAGSVAALIMAAGAALAEMNGATSVAAGWKVGVARARITPEKPVWLAGYGGQKLFALGGEIVSGYAVEIKRRHGADAFVMGYCNDVMSYMPTPEMWDQGGYEIRDANLCYGLPAPWKRDVTERILDAVDRLAGGK